MNCRSPNGMAKVELRTATSITVGIMNCKMGKESRTLRASGTPAPTVIDVPTPAPTVDDGYSHQLVVTLEVHTEDSNPAPVLRHTKRRTGWFRFLEDIDWPDRDRQRSFPAESGLIQPFPAFHFSVLHLSVPSPVWQRKRQTERCRTERWEKRVSRHSPQQRPRKQGRDAPG